MDLFTLIARITMDTSEYEKALEDAEKSAEKFSKTTDEKLTKSLKSASEEGTGFGSTMGAVLEGIIGGVADASSNIGDLIGTLADCVNLAAELGDNVDKGSKKLGISAQAYQEWNYALKQSGTNITALEGGMTNINKLLGDGNLPKKAAEAFDALGITAEDANGQIKTAEAVMSELFTKLANYEGTSEQRGVLIEALFGARGKSLAAFFDEGADGIDELIQRAHDLGLVMSDEEVGNAVKYGDAMNDLKSTIEALKASIGQSLLEPLQQAVDLVTQIIAKFSNGEGLIKNIADMLGDQSVLDAFGNLVSKAFGAIFGEDFAQGFRKFIGLSAGENGLLNWTKAQGKADEFQRIFASAERSQEKLNQWADSFANDLKSAGFSPEDVQAITEYIKSMDLSDIFNAHNMADFIKSLSDADKKAEALNKIIAEIPTEKNVTINVNTRDEASLLRLLSGEDPGGTDGSFAKGNWDVPYDMPAYLHRGETVLTASQARGLRNGEFSGGTGEIVGALKGLRNDLTNMQLVVGRKTFGRAVVNYGGRRMQNYIGGSDSRLAAGYGT